MTIKEFFKPTLTKSVLAILLFLILSNYLYYNTICPADAPQLARNCPNGFVFTNFSGYVMLNLYLFGPWKFYSMLPGYSPSILWFSFVYHLIISYIVSCIIISVAMKNKVK